MAQTLFSIPIVILAGGQSSRLKVDGNLKWQLPLPSHYLTAGDHRSTSSLNRKSASPLIPNKHEETLLSFIITRLKKQTRHILINGPYRGNNALKEYDLPIIPDQLPDFQGPLSGILTALHWAKEQHLAQVATVSCDTPFLPNNLLKSLSECLQDTQRDAHKIAAIATHQGRTHPTIGLWPIELYEPLKKALEVDHIRAVNRWALQHAQKVEFDLSTIGLHKVDPFLNINTIDDYEKALSYLA